MKNIFLIGGPSASGKSTLAKALATRIGGAVLCLDDYFIGRPRVFVQTAAGEVRTFERPSLYDGARLAKDASAVDGNVVVEGFCLFAFPAIMALSALRFYVDVPFEICLARRMARTPRRLSDKAFQAIGERETTKFVVPQKLLPGVIVLNGMRDHESLIADILRLALGKAA